MHSISRLGRQIAEVAATLDGVGAQWALVGGLALASYSVIRATQDVDLLVDAANADAIDTELARLGYSCLHRSGDAGNYLRGDERVDFLYASRPIARRLLADARAVQTSLGRLRVISMEGLIGFKLQGFASDARRTQDPEDIRALLRANRDRVDVAEVREYFRSSTRTRCSMHCSTKPTERLRRFRRERRQVGSARSGGTGAYLDVREDSEHRTGPRCRAQQKDSQPLSRHSSPKGAYEHRRRRWTIPTWRSTT